MCLANPTCFALLLALTIPSAASAQGSLQVVERDVDGAVIRLTEMGPDFRQGQVSVREVASGLIVVPPQNFQGDTLRLPLAGIPASVLQPNQAYEIIVKAIPDGRELKTLVEPFVAVAPMTPVPNAAIEALLVESDIDLADRYAKHDKIRAQADLLWAVNRWHRDVADLRIKLAVAQDIRLDAWNKTVKEYFNRREANIAGKMQVIDKYQQAADQRLRVRQANKGRVLQTLLDDPRYAGKPESSLNFLLTEFSDTPIGYGAGVDEYFANNPSHSRWDLSPEMLEAIRVQTAQQKGAQIQFKLSDPVPLQLDWWPPLLRESVFAVSIQNVIASRDQLVRLSEQTPQLPIEAVNQLEFACSRLAQDFYSRFPPPWKNMPTIRVRELIAVEGHLIQMSKEVEAIRDRGTLNAMTAGQYFDPLEDGKNAATLIAWMTRNGMQFAKPRPGDEQAYTNLLSQMKELMIIFGDPLPDRDAPLPKSDPPRSVVIPRAQ